MICTRLAGAVALLGVVAYVLVAPSAAADYSQLGIISSGAGSGAWFPWSSPDGQTVIFENDAPALQLDTDSESDIYRWSNGSLTQVSTGPAGGNGAYRPP